MTGQSPPKLLVSGHRFAQRRMEHALVRGDVRMLDDPLRAQSLALATGCVVAVVAVAACAILAVLQPKSAVGDSAVVMVRDSGAMYVRIGDTVHPVLNLASARLLAGAPAKPELVSASAIDTVDRGPLVGIPGAPDVIATPMAESVWTVCDDASSTTSVLGGALPDGLVPGSSALVTARGESAATTYLLYGGRRASVDLRNPVVVRALQLDGVVPRPVSRALLDAIPETAAIAVPRIVRSGQPSAVPGFPVGTVLRVSRTESTEYYVALAGGVQRVGEVAADLIRFARASNDRDIAAVAPAVIGSVPIVDELAVGGYPERGGVTDAPVLCAHWRGTDGRANTTVLMGDSLPGDDILELAQADGAGPRVDKVRLPRGRSAFVRAVAVLGDGTDNGTSYLVDDTGVTYGIGDDDAAKRLGLTGEPLPAPWPVLSRLPRGPVLSLAAASVERDGVGATS
jgi:type VII secretion protein EccB